LPPVEDQLELGSCTSFAAGAAIRYARKKQGLADFVTSHLFLYFCSRLRTQKYLDTGATLRDTIKAAARMGDCPEADWPYDISKFASKPPQGAYLNALHDRAISYQRVTRSIAEMKGCLASGLPFLAGISVYESFESDEAAKTGMIPMPGRDEQLLGGHAILICGYHDEDQKWLFRNSWSSSWAEEGYGFLDYSYLLNKGLASDFWVVKTVG
jgi:C1A family cysteine protease